MKIEPVEVKPEFDIMYFLDMSGQTRIEGELMDRMEEAWTDWLDRVFAFRIAPEKAKKGEGYLLVYLAQSVEEAVEAAWEVSPTQGETFHNLAVTLVMASAQSVIPELLDSCAPLPKPGKAVQEAFRQAGVEWNPQIAKLNREYALFTLMPYRGGCELCFQSSSCPNSTLGQQ
jgi:hypothetical protein